MKKTILLGIFATITLFLTGCVFEDENAVEYTDYIGAAMDATYYGNSERYLELTDATITEATDLYNSAIEYLANTIMSYNEVNSEYISDKTLQKYDNLAKEALLKTKYTVNDAKSVDGIYQVKIEIQPLDIWESTYDEVEEYIGKFNEKYPDYENMTDEEILAAEEEYAKEVLAIITPYVEDIKYKETVSKIVEISFDEDGLYGIPDEDWNDIDDYVMGIK